MNINNPIHRMDRINNVIIVEFVTSTKEWGITYLNFDRSNTNYIDGSNGGFNIYI